LGRATKAWDGGRLQFRAIGLEHDVADERESVAFWVAQRLHAGFFDAQWTGTSKPFVTEKLARKLADPTDSETRKPEGKGKLGEKREPQLIFKTFIKNEQITRGIGRWEP